MDWSNPTIIVLILPAVAVLWWIQRKSTHPMSPRRRRALFIVRSCALLLALAALAGPAWRRFTHDEAVVFVMDHSHSQGKAGLAASYRKANQLAASLPRGTRVGFVSVGESAVVRRQPGSDSTALEPDLVLLKKDGAQTDLAAAVDLARGLFPVRTARRLVLVGDGVETRGNLEAAARDAAASGIVIDAAPIRGETRPDARVVQVVASRSRLHEGATLALTAELESSLAGKGIVRLFENGVLVQSSRVELVPGRKVTKVFRRTPQERNLYTYRVRLEGLADDAIPDNDEGMTLVDVRGRPLLLYIEGEPGESHYLAEAMAQEGIRLHVRPAEALPQSLGELAAYDGVILSDVPAHQVGERSMSLLRDYVEQLGGGFLMIGGTRSFGVGGYYRTPIEDILPVKMKAPDKEEKVATALVLVIDRSGSMDGPKLEVCKSAAIATVELLSRKDYLGVVAFDSAATWVVPMTQVTSKSTIAAQIAGLNSGGGTNIQPGMTAGRDAIAAVTAKVKHMIVLSDGQTEGGGYQAMAAQMKADRITVSTVAVGDGADIALMQSIAAAGGGQFYQSLDPSNIPRIFTQDAMTHLGRLIREEAFAPQQVERHPMLAGFAADKTPQLLGYVQTNRKATAQVPLVTDLGDPLLARWRFGLGKVTAFTSDCKSRWASLWISGWSGYGQFWSQVLREMAREPQGRHMDIRLEEEAGRGRIAVDLLEDAGQFKNDASVDADVYFVPATALGSSLKQIQQVKLEQQGPGEYDGYFQPDKPGVYLVRARSGADLVSAGLVHEVSGESATGQVNRQLLEKVTRLTGGKVLASAATRLPAIPAGHARYVELAPYLLQLLLLCFIADLVIRRWENLIGLVEWFRR